MSTAGTSQMISLLRLDPASYTPHLLHASSRSYPETNCYTDIVIELVHATGHEPLAMMGCALRVDFEGDQWTFFKPVPEHLERLYGIDIHEMQPYRPLPQQIAEQIGQGRTIAVELDSWYLPDTEATSYRTEHVKSSVIAEAIDVDGQRLRYFHGPSLFELSDEDFCGVFRLGADLPGDVLPPYTELVRFDAGRALRGEDLRAASMELLSEHLGRAPKSNPFTRFDTQLGEALPGLLEGDEAAYHDYAFATVRMVGSAFEAAASHVQWLLGDEGASATDAMMQIVQTSKVLSFKLARRRDFDPRPAIDEMSRCWETALSSLGAIVS